MRKVTEYRTRRIVIQHLIYGTPRSGSYADYVLLKQVYLRLDPNVGMTKKKRKFEQLLFNTEFIEGVQRKHGELHCEYCGKKNLVLYYWWRREQPDYQYMATADHFQPKSLFPHLALDTENLRVCCFKCNQKKKDKIWAKNMIKFPYT